MTQTVKPISRTKGLLAAVLCDRIDEFTVNDQLGLVTRVMASRMSSRGSLSAFRSVFRAEGKANYSTKTIMKNLVCFDEYETRRNCA